MDAKPLYLLASSWLATASVLGALVVSTGCSTPAVGDPCLPEQVPATGFVESEAYIESSSVQCETRVCLVYQLNGDPRPGCTPAGTTPTCSPDDKTCIEPPTCALACQPGDPPSANCIDNRVYCTCRCDAGDTGFAECECPDGFSCHKLLEQGGPGVRGSYCVRNGTFTD